MPVSPYVCARACVLYVRTLLACSACVLCLRAERARVSVRTHARTFVGTYVCVRARGSDRASSRVRACVRVGVRVCVPPMDDSVMN